MKTIPEPAPVTTQSFHSLEQYLKEIAAYPLLRRDEEQTLARRAQQGDAAARELLINSNLRLVVSQAQKFKGLGISLEDLVAEGNTGLMTAVDRFKPDLGAGLCTYAIWWIRQRMMRAIEDHGRTVRLPAYVGRRVRQMRVAISQLTQSLGREPEDWEVALHLRASEDDYKKTLGAAATTISLDETAPGAHSPLSESLIAEDAASLDPAAVACRNCDGNRVREFLAKLPPRLRLIVERRFGIACDHACSLSEIGKELSVTRERIRQLERKAMALLRQAAYRLEPQSGEHLLDETLPVPSHRSPRKRKTAPVPAVLSMPAAVATPVTPFPAPDAGKRLSVSALRVRCSPPFVPAATRLKSTG